VVLLDGRTLAVITLVQRITVRLPGSRFGPGVALCWDERGGTASGVMVRADGAVLHRVLCG
jgi:hypothetical protein